MIEATSPTHARLTHHPAKTSDGKCTPRYMRVTPIDGTYTADAAITRPRHGVGHANTHAQPANAALAMA